MTHYRLPAHASEVKVTASLYPVSVRRPSYRFILPVVLGSITVLLTLQTFAPGPRWRGSFGLAVMDWVPWLILAPAILWLGRRLQITARTWLWALPSHLVIGLAIAFSLGVLAQHALRAGLIEFPLLINPNTANLPPSLDMTALIPDEMFRGVVARFAFPIYAVLIAASHALSYHQKSIERERRALLAEARAVESRLLALQMQLNPHFLFNALNAVSGLIHENPRQADAMLCSLCDLLRSVLESGDRREVTLAEELALVERYLDIQRIRFADRLTVKLEIDPATLDAAVPTLLLQPLVENAIIHGIAPHSRPGIVTLRARRQGDRLRLEIADDGPGPQLPVPAKNLAASPAVRSGGIGVSNTRNRLAALYGDDHSFSLQTGPGGALASVEIPFHSVGA